MARADRRGRCRHPRLLRSRRRRGEHGLVQETARGVTAFYDIDTPVTLAKLARGRRGLSHPPTLDPELRSLSLLHRRPDPAACWKRHYGARAARALYCSVDPDLYQPDRRADALGSRLSRHLQPGSAAGARTAAARLRRDSGPICASWWPARNIRRTLRGRTTSNAIEHLPPAEHAGFYSSLRWTLNVTRADMVAAGFSPSVRLFEAAACGAPIISDPWAGLDTILRPGSEMAVVAHGARDVLAALDRPNVSGWRSPKQRGGACWPNTRRASSTRVGGHIRRPPPGGRASLLTGSRPSPHERVAANSP